MVEHQKDESKRVAQHKLAAEFTELIHGVDAAEEAGKQHRALFKKNMSLDEVLEFARNQQSQAPATVDSHPAVSKNAKPQSIDKYSTTQMELPREAVINQPLSRVLWSAGLAASKNEAQKLINNKGAYIGARNDGNGQMSDSLTYMSIQDPKWEWWEKYILDGKLLILRTGKWRVKIINIVSDEEFVEKGLSCPGFGAEASAAPEKVQKPDRPRQEARETFQTPNIAVEEVEGRSGWDEMTPMPINKRTQKLLNAQQPRGSKGTVHRSPIAPQRGR